MGFPSVLVPSLISLAIQRMVAIKLFQKCLFSGKNRENAKVPPLKMWIVQPELRMHPSEGNSHYIPLNMSSKGNNTNFSQNIDEMRLYFKQNMAHKFIKGFLDEYLLKIV